MRTDETPPCQFTNESLPIIPTMSGYLPSFAEYSLSSYIPREGQLVWHGKLARCTLKDPLLGFFGCGRNLDQSFLPISSGEQASERYLFPISTLIELSNGVGVGAQLTDLSFVHCRRISDTTSRTTRRFTDLTVNSKTLMRLLKKRRNTISRFSAISLLTTARTNTNGSRRRGLAKTAPSATG